jgi:hypothetical protein
MKLNLGLPWQKQHLTEDSFHQQIELKFQEETVECYVWSIALYGAETWTLKVDPEKP